MRQADINHSSRRTSNIQHPNNTSCTLITSQTIYIVNVLWYFNSQLSFLTDKIKINSIYQTLTPLIWGWYLIALPKKPVINDDSILYLRTKYLLDNWFTPGLNMRWYINDHIITQTLSQKHTLLVFLPCADTIQSVNIFLLCGSTWTSYRHRGLYHKQVQVY